MKRYRVTFSHMVEEIEEYEVELDRPPDTYDLYDLYDIATDDESSVLIDEGETGYGKFDLTDWGEVDDDGDETAA